ncbi:MAG: cysteine desulfurase family protein [Myxococcota bacterium]|nr:cysteine desulfurase family protein [Myxococcota bacterium]
MNRPIYLDHHATTPLAPEVLEVMMPYLTNHFGNASSSEHAFGWRAEEAVELARSQVASLVGCTPHEIIFTSGATEANNLGIRGVAEAYAKRGGHLVTQATEHAAVLDVCRDLEAKGHPLTVLPVDQLGTVMTDDLTAALRDDTVLVSIMGANNEVGTVQPFEELSELTTNAGAIFHCDMAQMLGRCRLDLSKSKIGLASFSAHKLYGPKGVGALYVSRRNPRVVLSPQQVGGGHERGWRSGTLNVPGIVGFGAACVLAAELLDQEADRQRRLANQLVDEVSQGLDGACIVHGSRKARLPGNVSFGFEGVDGEKLLLALAELAVSSGAACASAKQAPSHVLAAMGVPVGLAQATLRVGLGRSTTEANILFAAERIVSVVKELRDA